LNTNADALFHREQPTTEVTALTMTSISLGRLKESQHSDPTITQIYNTLMVGSAPLSGRQWQYPPLHRYKKLWSQLHLVNGIVCRRYHPSSSAHMVTVPLLPPNLQPDALCRCQDDPTGGDMKSHSIKYTRKLIGYQCHVTLNNIVENALSAKSLNHLPPSEHL